MAKCRLFSKLGESQLFGGAAISWLKYRHRKRIVDEAISMKWRRSGVGGGGYRKLSGAHRRNGNGCQLSAKYRKASAAAWRRRQPESES